jgi:catechol 2,3-dioxygenase-like lactoylglutathione lyase family enzyme
MAVPSIAGILESSLYVADVGRSARFYQDLFGFDELARDERLCALGVGGRQVLLIFQKDGSREAVRTGGGHLPPHFGSGQLHVAFAIAAPEFEAWRKTLADKGIAVESIITWPRGGRSLYFRDLDGHLVELATPGVWAIY